MIVRWRTWKNGGGSIDRCEFARETRDYLILRNPGIQKRVAKKSDYFVHHETWAEARRFLIDAAALKISRAEATIHAQRQRVNELMAMEEPK